MKKLNIYYIVSIVTLVLMMFILFRTLEVTGWFDEPVGKSPAETCFDLVPGDYRFQGNEDTQPAERLTVRPVQQNDDSKLLMVSLDLVDTYFIEISDFEDEQVLFELYEIDSAGTPQRLDGCELLLVADSSGIFTGNTIGDFCGLKEQSSEYLAMDLLLSGPVVSLEIQTGVLGEPDSLDAKKYLLERIDSW